MLLFMINIFKIQKVVCGASNARDGLLTVYAGPGAIIPKNQLKIKVTNIRGIDSYGMLCSESELGLSDESQGITELDSKKFKVGSSYFKNNSEPAIDISITPNRSDCQGVRGIARDLSTAGLGKLIDLEEIKLKTNVKNPFKVIIQPNSGCSSGLQHRIRYQVNCYQIANLSFFQLDLNSSNILLLL